VCLTLVVHQPLCVAKAASALRFMAKRGIGLLGRAGTGARKVAHFALGDRVADTQDHLSLYNDNANHSQLFQSEWRRKRRVMKVKGIATSTICANSCVTMEIVLGGSGVPKRSGTTSQFIAK